jgi:lipoprotein NlpI
MPRVDLVRHAPAICLLLLFASFVPRAWAEEDPADKKLAQDLDVRIAALTERIADQPKSADLYSRRGDAFFFRGKFPEAVADYDKMIELNPDLSAGHWRRGIACFYAGRYKDAARQFEEYHSFDDVDRENGIWRYFSQTKAYGADKAREGLLKYKKDDREPFPAVYEMFAGRLTPAQLLEKVRAAKTDGEEREKQLFYAELYVGLYEAIAGDSEKALPHLQEATRSPWPATAGYGPNYMQHVGRLHRDLLQAKTDKPK